MDRNRMEKNREKIRCAHLFGMLFLPLLVTGCTTHDSRFSYFNMLDNKKKTAYNRQTAEKFWSAMRPVSTLSASHYKLGRYYQQQGKYDKAIEEFSRALRHDSSYCKAYNGIAMTYDALQRCDMASSSYEQAMQCAPQQAYVYNNYACSSILCGEYEKGLALLLEAVNLSRDNRRILTNLQLAQSFIDRENGLVRSVPLGTAPELVARIDENPPQAAFQESPTESVHEQPGNSSPEGTLKGAGAESRAAGGAAETIVRSPVQVNELGELTAAMISAGETVNPSGGDTDVDVVREEGKSVSSVQTRIVVDDLAIEQSRWIRSENKEGPGIVYLVPGQTKRRIVCLVPSQTKRRIHTEDQPEPAFAFLNGFIEVSNGNGVAGMAVRSSEFLRYYGFSIGRITNAENFHFYDTTIFYREGYLQVVKELVSVIPGVQAIEKVDSLGRSSIGVRIILGKDLARMQFPEGYVRNFEYSMSGTADYISSINSMNKISKTN